MTLELGLILLLFAAVGYAGAGAAFAVARTRVDAEAERDFGMLGVAALLVGFATLCAAVLGGLAAVLAIGTIVTWAGYMFTAQRAGLFRVHCGSLGEVPAEEPHQRT
jgi:hypothetical protein